MDKKISTARRSVWTGVLSNIASQAVEGVPTMTGTLTGLSRGVEVQTPVMVSGDLVETVKDVFVEGPFALYGHLVDGVFTVLGRDTRSQKVASPVANKAVAAETVVAEAATPKPARPGIEEGVLSEIKAATSKASGRDYVAAKLTRADGSVVTLLASGEALEKTRHLFVEGPTALYGQARPDGKTVNVMGPDLRRATLAKAAEQVAA
jgi:hypothetical protein